MIITCEQCQARFKLADEKLKSEGTKVRCSKCQSIFTVFPPPPLAEAPAEPEEPVGPTSAETEAETTSAPAPALDSFPMPAASAAEMTTAESSASDLDFDFGTQISLPGEAAAEESFSFAGTTPPDDETGFSAEPGTFLAKAEEAPATGPVEFDFETTISEAPATTPSELAYAAGAVEFDFDAAPTTGTSEAAEDFATAGAFDFAEEPPGDNAPGDFDFDSETTSDDEDTGFSFASEATTDSETAELLPGSESNQVPEAESAAGYGEFNFGETGGEAFAFGTQTEAEPLAFGEKEDSWGDPERAELDSINFDEPSFESQPAPAAPKAKNAEPVFGEIDFSDDDGPGETFPSFDNVPNFSQPPPPSPASPPPPVAAAPVQRAPSNRPRSEELLPLPAPRRSPVSTMVVALVILLVVLCGAGGYLYMSGDGERLIAQLVMKIKGEQPAGPVEQKIGLKVSGSSYVKNRDAGQLLVIQGTATNDFTTTRSAISVKGLLLDAAGKTLQQQTVFCGNRLSEEKLRTLKYAEIEEAMNNQFGDSLINMNVKPATTIDFTIVFRNVPKEMANINVEVVDSKPGGS